MKIDITLNGLPILPNIQYPISLPPTTILNTIENTINMHVYDGFNIPLK
jgi:hypothetical protein